MELDENFKRLIKDLGNAISESLSESDKIAEVLGQIRAAGFDLFLVLEVTVGFNKRGETSLVHRQDSSAAPQQEGGFRLTHQDAKFLRELKISIEDPGS